MTRLGSLACRAPILLPRPSTSSRARATSPTAPQKAPARAMLRAVGMTDDDWDKPQIGIASSWNEVTPVQHDAAQARRARQGRRARRRRRARWSSARSPVSDGISMGHEGMRASLVSREVICDSVETVVFAERLDGFVGLAGCDKSMPGDADGGGPPRPAQRVRLQRLDHARATTTARRSTSPACSRPSAPTPPARSPRTSWARSSARPARARAPAAACSPPTR